MAYPENSSGYKKATEELNSIAATVATSSNTKLLLAFSGTGLPGTEITGSFSFALTKWMADTYPSNTEIDSSNAEAETIRLFFREILPRTEYENIYSGELGLLARIKKLKGKNKESQLAWLIRQIDNSLLKERDKEAVFHNLEIFIRWQIPASQTERTFSFLNEPGIFIHKQIQRKASIKTILQKKLPVPEKISSAIAALLIDIARHTLSLNFRETEPFTYADSKEVRLFRLERGLTIALFGMNRERRLSLESYVGYLAFKNGVPVAYGGGWLFGHRCQFGINILPPFRGGESALIFYQLLRVYKQYYNAGLFAVKPYQFGKNNKEALSSGAFWFYYKAGFRPENFLLRKIAALEWKKIKENKGYRTPLHILKKLTGSNLMLRLRQDAFPIADAAIVSTRITDFINDQFNGDRKRATSICLNKTKKELGIHTLSSWSYFEKKALTEWSLPAQSLLQISRWKKSDKKQFIHLVRLKGSEDERKFVLSLQACSCFWKDLLYHHNIT